MAMFLEAQKAIVGLFSMNLLLFCYFQWICNSCYFQWICNSKWKLTTKGSHRWPLFEVLVWHTHVPRSGRGLGKIVEFIFSSFEIWVLQNILLLNRSFPSTSRGRSLLLEYPGGTTSINCYIPEISQKTVYLKKFIEIIVFAFARIQNYGNKCFMALGIAKPLSRQDNGSEWTWEPCRLWGEPSLRTRRHSIQSTKVIYGTMLPLSSQIQVGDLEDL